MSPRDSKFRLDDIIEALQRIEKYTEGLDYDGWKKDEKTIDAVIRNLEIIGEAANYVPELIQEKYSEIPWSQMRAMRNVLIHEYFGVDVDILWHTISEELPDLKNKLQAIDAQK